MKAISAAHLSLGEELRRVRTARGVSTRHVRKQPAGDDCFSSGHISLVENGRTVPSPELIDAYVRLAGDGARLRTLYAQMLAASASAGRRRRAGPTACGIAAPQDLAEVTSRAELQQHYLVERNIAEYQFGPEGAIASVNHAAYLRATSPSVRIYCAGHSYPADSRPGVLSIFPEEGASLITTRESITGAIQSFFELDRPAEPTDPEPSVVRYRLRVNSKLRSAPHLRFHAELGNQSLTLRARFTTPAVPGTVWWFAVPNVVDAEYPQPANQLGPEQGGAFSHGFDHLLPGWCYGLGWVW
jgi:transcriptional regulator with XRE-family HTH domain